MSYWYEKTKKDITPFGVKEKELHIYLGTEDDLPYPDFGAMYVSIPIKDVLEYLKENNIDLK